MTEVIKKAIFDLVDFQTDIEISYEDFDGVKVIYDGEKAIIGCNSKSTLARGYFLLAMRLSKSAEPFTLSQHMQFQTLGVSLDVSRGGAPTVAAIKHYLVKMAALGFNMLMLYMEDMFELEGFPRFGYMRGRYSAEELKEIDDFADQFGIEVVPEIEALGHMEQYLQWQEADPIRNTGNTLLADNEKTYEFLEHEIRTMRKIFRSGRIAPSMDEAYGLNLGRYQQLHGPQDMADVFFRHMNRVVSICEKYNFRPMVSLDMVFRLASKTGAYYDLDVEFSQTLKDRLPKGIDNFAWSYGVPKEIDMDHYGIDTEGYYKRFLGKHSELGESMVFATAIWCWEGYFEDTTYTLESSVPAMRNALKEGFREVVVTTWGDQGTETNIIKQTAGTLPVYSEYCFRGLDCTMEDITDVSTFLEKMPFQHKVALMDRMHGDFHDCQKFHKCLLYGDILYNLIDHKYDYEKVSRDYLDGASLCLQFLEEDPRNEAYYRFCLSGFQIGRLKLDLWENLRRSYLENDRDYLRRAAYELIPDIINYTGQFYDLFQENWDETNKPFGSENGQIRLGGVMKRAEYVAERLKRYLNGELPALEELDQEILLSQRTTYNHGFRKNTTANVVGLV